MTDARNRYALFIDESGLPHAGDPSQGWFVLAGVCVPEKSLPVANEYFHTVVAKYLTPEQVNCGSFELKGKSLLKPNPSRRPFGLSLGDRVEMCRELLAIDIVISGAALFVYAVNTTQPEVEELEVRYDWSAYLPNEHRDTFLLPTLCDLIAHFAFFLDRDASSGFDFDLAGVGGERWVDRGVVYIDPTTYLSKKLTEFEECLRVHRSTTLALGGQRLPIPFQLLQDNIKRPFEFRDSQSTPMIQIADILAALVRIRLMYQDLSPALEQLYCEANLSFQTRSRFLPRGKRPRITSFAMSPGRARLLRRWTGSGVKSLDWEWGQGAG